MTMLEELAELESLIDGSDISLRRPDTVMQPTNLGAARMTRFSFSRSMIRRAFLKDWDIKRLMVEFDNAGSGQIVYQILSLIHI